MTKTGVMSHERYCIASSNTKSGTLPLHLGTVGSECCSTSCLLNMQARSLCSIRSLITSTDRPKRRLDVHRPTSVMETPHRAAADGIDTELLKVSVLHSGVQGAYLALLPHPGALHLMLLTLSSQQSSLSAKWNIRILPKPQPSIVHHLGRPPFLSHIPSSSYLLLPTESGPRAAFSSLPESLQPFGRRARGATLPQQPRH